MRGKLQNGNCFQYRNSHMDTATAYFAPWFIREPMRLPGWEIDLATSTVCNPQHETEIHYPVCFEGVLVKCDHPQEVWRLTGHVDDQGFFEGRWPD